MVAEGNETCWMFFPEGLCLLWCYPTCCIFHLLPFCSLLSLASSLLICLLNQGRFSCLCFNVRFVFSFRQDIPQSLVTLQNDPFLAKPVVDFIFLLIFICYIHSLFTLLALKIHLRLLRLSAGRARFRTSPPPSILRQSSSAAHLCAWRSILASSLKLCLRPGQETRAGENLLSVLCFSSPPLSQNTPSVMNASR